MRHPGVDKDVTVLWCKNEVERDVGAAAARHVCAAPDVAAAGDGGRHQQPVPAQLDVRQAHALPTGQVQPPPSCSMHNRVEQLGLQQHSAAFMQHAARLLLRCNRDAPPGETRFGTTLWPA